MTGIAIEYLFHLLQTIQLAPGRRFHDLTCRDPFHVRGCYLFEKILSPLRTLRTDVNASFVTHRLLPLSPVVPCLIPPPACCLLNTTFRLPKFLRWIAAGCRFHIRNARFGCFAHCLNFLPVRFPVPVLLSRISMALFPSPPRSSAMAWRWSTSTRIFKSAAWYSRKKPCGKSLSSSKACASWIFHGPDISEPSGQQEAVHRRGLASSFLGCGKSMMGFRSHGGFSIKPLVDGFVSGSASFSSNSSLGISASCCQRAA